MKQYFNQWTYKRLIQLGFGLYFFWEYLQHESILAILFGVFMSFQAIANVGCFSSRGCTTNNIQRKNDTFSDDDDIDFEEIK